MSKPLPDQAPVVIVGGGIIGVSTLYHLAHRGVPAVLIERKKIACGTTWHAAGIVGQLRDSTSQTELGKYTAKLFQALEIETGQGTGYKQNGTINLALSDVRHEQLLRSHDHAARMGIPTQILSVPELQEYWPDVEVSDVKSAFFVPSNGQVNPLDVSVAMSKGARALGAQVFEETKVERLVLKNGKVTGVETDRGVIATEKVLIAGGMWSHLFAKAHGATVPLHAAEHFYIVTEPVEGLPSTQPILNIAEERTYWKEDAGKLLIGGFEAMGKPYARNGIPEDFEFDELPFDMEHVEPELERMFARMPALAEMGIQTFFNGPESFTPDGRPYMGPSSEIKGVYLATGMNSNGILNSGGTGLTMAEWIIDGMPSRSMLPLLAVRAHPFQKNTAYNAERAAEAVGFHYGIHWAGRQVTSARGVRRVLLHDRLKESGAQFAERIGWEVPMYYGGDWRDEPSIRWKPWSAHVKDECLAARDAAVILDQSMYAKIQVQGPDAAKALNRVCGAEMDVAVGTSVYTQFLNARGGIEADVTVTRIAPQSFMVVSGHPSQMRDKHWIKSNADEDWRFEVFDATSAFGLLTLHGPKSRAILQAISGDDLSNDAFPFGAAREIDVAHARALTIRRSFLGELGYELMAPTEFTAGIYDALLEAGKPHGLRHMGMFAMNACRLEKGFRHFGHDIGEDDTPFETGLGFAVRLDKEDFVGREALLKQKAESATPLHRTVSITVPGLTAEEGPYLIHNEPIWKDGKIVGHVTSGDWGFRLEQMIGLASLENSDGVSKSWIDEGGFEVQIAGQMYPITAQLAPFYDPKGEIMRG
ncbi:FAD-dependent oxidoreductase [Ruegeria lacuscaerulensis]|uniref:FAD-dependent oxidoreductase n=1 Tax=Ruegeria lacuscaerulensis TaxID=55218 RepID=UPI00147EBCB3|nr:FAD-dependent oxidoreductase [Ruegeria lacuscaerulensis]